MASNIWGRRSRLLAAGEGLPDLVFTANAALIYRERAVLAHFRHPERQGEEPTTKPGSRRPDLASRRCRHDLHFEGAGDALFCGDTLFAGYRIRSDARGHQQIGEMLGCRVIPLELVDPYYYHLDTCFCPLAPGKRSIFRRPSTTMAATRLAAQCGGADRRRRRQKRGDSPATRSSSAAPSSPTRAARRCTHACASAASSRTKRRSTSSSKPAAAPNA